MFKRMLVTAVGLAILAPWACSKKELNAEKAGEAVGKTASRFLRGLGKGAAKEGEKTGEALAEGATKLATGAGKGVAKHGDKAGEALAEGTGEVLKGAARGAARSLKYSNIEVEVTKELEGVSVKRAQVVIADDVTKTVVFAALPAGFSGKLKLDAVDAKGVVLFSDTVSAKAAGETTRLEFSRAEGFATTDVKRYRLSKGS